MGSPTRPERLLKGENCTNSLTTVLGLGAVLQNTVELEPDETNVIFYAVGLAASLEEARQTVQEAFRARL